MDITWLENQVFQRTLEPKERDAVCAVFEEKQLARGEKLMQRDDPGGVLYFLKEGSAEVIGYSRGQPIRFSYSTEGAVFGEMTFLTGGKVSADVVALKPCTVYRIERPAFAEMMCGYSGLVFSVFAYMLGRASGVIRHMNDQHVAMHQFVTGRAA